MLPVDRDIFIDLYIYAFISKIARVRTNKRTRAIGDRAIR